MTSVIIYASEYIFEGTQAFSFILLHPSTQTEHVYIGIADSTTDGAISTAVRLALGKLTRPCHVQIFIPFLSYGLRGPLPTDELEALKRQHESISIQTFYQNLNMKYAGKVHQMAKFAHSLQLSLQCNVAIEVPT